MKLLYVLPVLYALTSAQAGHDALVLNDSLDCATPGMWGKDKSGKGYGQFQWRIGMLTPVAAEAEPN